MGLDPWTMIAIVVFICVAFVFLVAAVVIWILEFVRKMDSNSEVPYQEQLARIRNGEDAGLGDNPVDENGERTFPW
jgi:hypothetical protein